MESAVILKRSDQREKRHVCSAPILVYLPEDECLLKPSLYQGSHSWENKRKHMQQQFKIPNNPLFFIPTNISLFSKCFLKNGTKTVRGDSNLAALAGPLLMVISACWVMSTRCLPVWLEEREQLGWSVSLCWCEKGPLIMIPGRVLGKSLPHQGPFRPSSLKHMHACLPSLFCTYFIMCQGSIKKEVNLLL